MGDDSGTGNEYRKRDHSHLYLADGTRPTNNDPDGDAYDVGEFCCARGDGEWRRSG